MTQTQPGAGKLARHWNALGRAGQILAITLLTLICAIIVHKGYNDISRIAEKHSGTDFWVELARYAIGNLAGGAKKPE
jgi:hypothetical protein